MATKQQAIQIKTPDQFNAAYREIQRKTQWSRSRIAREANITPEALRKFTLGDTKVPNSLTCEKLAMLLDIVRSWP